MAMIDRPGRAAARSRLRPSSAMVGWAASRYRRRMHSPMAAFCPSATGKATSWCIPFFASAAARSVTGGSIIAAIASSPPGVAHTCTRSGHWKAWSKRPMTSHTQLCTSSGRVIATFITWAPPQSWPTRWTGCPKRSNSVTSQRRYSSTVAVNRRGTGAPKPGGDRRTTGPRSRSGSNLFQTAAVSGLPWTRHTVTRFPFASNSNIGGGRQLNDLVGMVRGAPPWWKRRCRGWSSAYYRHRSHRVKGLMVDSRGHRGFSDGTGPGQRRSSRAGIVVSAYSFWSAHQHSPQQGWFT